MDFDESIFGPLRLNKLQEWEKEKPAASSRESRVTAAVSAYATMDLDERIFGLIKGKETRKIGNDKQLVTKQPPPFPIITSADCGENIGQCCKKTPGENKDLFKQPHLLSVSMDSSTSIDCDESVLGPIGRNYRRVGRQCRTFTTNRDLVQLEPTANDGAGAIDTSNVGILGPSLEATRRGRNGCFIAGERRIREGTEASTDQKRKASTFEMMMKSLEQSSSTHSSEPQQDETGSCLVKAGDCLCEMHYYITRVSSGGGGVGPFFVGNTCN